MEVVTFRIKQPKTRKKKEKSWENKGRITNYGKPTDTGGKS